MAAALLCTLLLLAAAPATAKAAPDPFTITVHDSTQSIQLSLNAPLGTTLEDLIDAELIDINADPAYTHTYAYTEIKQLYIQSTANIDDADWAFIQANLTGLQTFHVGTGTTTPILALTEVAALTQVRSLTVPSGTVSGTITDLPPW